MIWFNSCITQIKKLLLLMEITNSVKITLVDDNRGV